VLKGVDDIFSTEESRQAEQREQVQQIPIAELFPFKNHPFKVLDDESMARTVESVSNIILTHSNPENAVYCFMDKKRSEGKHYYVYTVAGSAKFLRVYYARVTEFLRSLPSSDAC